MKDAGKKYVVFTELVKNILLNTIEIQQILTYPYCQNLNIVQVCLNLVELKFLEFGVMGGGGYE